MTAFSYDNFSHTTAFCQLHQCFFFSDHRGFFPQSKTESAPSRYGVAQTIAIFCGKLQSYLRCSARNYFHYFTLKDSPTGIMSHRGAPLQKIRNSTNKPQKYLPSISAFQPEGKVKFGSNR